MLYPDTIRQALDRHPSQAIPPEGLRRSAVLLPWYKKNGEDTILFTRRTDRLKHHRGEISFPGGGRNPGDADLRQTALRETHEEMGIDPAHVRVLGRLDDFISVHGYHVVPFVGTFPHPYPFRVCGEEIAEVIEVPLSRLQEPSVFHQEDWRHRGREYPVYFYTVGRHRIWGLTAAILHQFLLRVFEGPE